MELFLFLGDFMLSELRGGAPETPGRAGSAEKKDFPGGGTLFIYACGVEQSLKASPFFQPSRIKGSVKRP